LVIFTADFRLRLTSSIVWVELHLSNIFLSNIFVSLGDSQRLHGT
jgi:hypothetical protein